MLDLLYYKRNPIITIVADESIFSKNISERKMLEDIFTQVLQ